ncbi:hypothetical protein D8O27_23015 [Burkholderia mallei]|uniref:Uncharacterized protein n=2 Tax=Burkholderia mallei TaxID=13373 RepID=A2RZG3_BURM9|nr:hypothetical protein BMA10229_1280 [Burkholderia mallei NCTC 10229]AIW47666.1 hypothetical protein DM57_06210 [Burkholderia mallei]EDP87127.1 hypothetical protein BMA10399_B1653 [Burkholderia mallei ATCC 10399]EEP52274.1 hypothetical protein GBP346_B2512 [Burkholderia pseudomallei MSHR346]ATD90648.1 hypothetical protein NM78_16525 [Burkholderia mallei]
MRADAARRERATRAPAARPRPAPACLPHRAASARLACAACVRATRGHGRRAGMRARPSSADAATRGGTHRRRRRAAQEARESWR